MDLYTRKDLIKDLKKLRKIGAGVVGAGLLVYGGLTFSEFLEIRAADELAKTREGVRTAAVDRLSGEECFPVEPDTTDEPDVRDDPMFGRNARKGGAMAVDYFDSAMRHLNANPNLHLSTAELRNAAVTMSNKHIKEMPCKVIDF